LAGSRHAEGEHNVAERDADLKVYEKKSDVLLEKYTGASSVISYLTKKCDRTETFRKSQSTPNPFVS
jgi:hypothetical protein